MAIVLIGATLAIYLLPIKSWLADSAHLRAQLLSLGIWVYPASVLIVAVLVGCGVPRLLLCGLMGAVLGFWWGLCIVQTGTMLGYYAVFLLTRWGGREWALRRWPALKKWAQIARDHRYLGVIFLRQLPIHGTIINVGLGLSHAKHRHFLIGTAIGTMPEAIPAALVGAGLVKGSLLASTSYIAAAVAGLAVVWIGCGYMMRAMRNSAEGSEMLAEAATLKDLSAQA
jgi:uncharacterized membrane protein YdjX (TVP38/TMEM64 family)